MIPACLVSGVSFAACLVLTATSSAATSPTSSPPSSRSGPTFAYSLTHHEGRIPDGYRVDVEPHEATVAEKVRSWAPFALIFVVLLVTSKLVPFINEPLAAIKSTVNIYAGDPTATLTFSWVDTPGVLIFICGIVGGLIQRCPVREMVGVLGETCKQMSKTIVTMLGVLACAKIMGYSGMIASIAAFFVSTLGGFYPLVAPLLAPSAPSSPAPAHPARSSLATSSSRPPSPSAPTRRGSWPPTRSASPPARCSARRTSPSAARHAASWARTARSSARSPRTRSASPS